jgi:hypothetical protein
MIFMILAPVALIVAISGGCLWTLMWMAPR